MKKFFLIISLFCFFCCNENKKSENQQIENRQLENNANEIKQKETQLISDTSQPLSLKQMKNIVENIYMRRVDTAVYYEFNNEKYIAAVHDENFETSTIYLLYEFGGTWQEKKVLEFEHHFGDFLGISFEEIGNSLCIYYSYTENGNVLGSIFFNVYDVNKNKSYELSFSGPVGSYNYLDEISNDLKKNPAVLSFLRKKVKESPLVEKVSDKENDNYHNNYQKEWYISNDRIHYKVNDNLYVWYPINTKEYERNEFAEYDKYSISAKTDSKKYRVFSIFKGEVFAFKKSNKKYIPLWEPENVYEWIDSLRMINSNTVILTKSGVDLYEINIDELKVRALSKKNLY